MITREVTSKTNLSAYNVCGLIVNNCEVFINYNNNNFISMLKNINNDSNANFFDIFIPAIRAQDWFDMISLKLYKPNTAADRYALVLDILEIDKDNDRKQHFARNSEINLKFVIQENQLASDIAYVDFDTPEEEYEVQRKAFIDDDLANAILNYKIANLTLNMSDIDKKSIKKFITKVKEECK